MPQYLDHQNISLAKSVADTYAAARSMFSLASSGLLTHTQASPTACQYIPWSIDDSSEFKVDAGVQSEPKSSTYTEMSGKEDPVEKFVEGGESNKVDLAWFQEITKRTEQSPQQCVVSAVYQDDENFIPFEHALVSRYGPIARLARSKLKNSEPVNVTANNKTLKHAVPVTVVASVDCPLPMSAPISSRLSTGYSIHGPHTALPSYHKTLRSDVLSMWPSGHDPFMMSSDPTGLVRHQLQRKVAHLEGRAHEAPTEDESLAYELQAIDLRISLQSVKQSEKTAADDVAKNVPVKPPPQAPVCSNTAWASDTALTRHEQKKLKDLARTFATNANVSQQEEQMLSQLLKLRCLGSQDFHKSRDHSK